MAEAAGLTRQGYAAIEAGSSVPSTEVALRLAAALGRHVEEIFRLPHPSAERHSATWAGSGPARPGRRVRVARIAGVPVAHPVDEAHRPTLTADGVVEAIHGPEVVVRSLQDAPPRADLVAVGCDPAFGIVAEALERDRGVETIWNARGSQGALEALARGEAHVAGAHLSGHAGGEGNTPWVRAAVPFPCTRISFAIWEQGFLARPDVRLRTPSDLGRRDIRLVNREEGSGSRMLLDAMLDRVGLSPELVIGYGTRARSHLAVAEAVASGTADVGVGIRAAGSVWGLEVLKLRQEAYELIIPDHFLDLPAVDALLDTLRRPGVRGQVEALGGYDITGMGKPAP